MEDDDDASNDPGMIVSPRVPSSVSARAVRVFRDGAFREDRRDIASEIAVAMTYNRVTHAVMMATPADLGDFALGFTLSERVVDDPSEIEECEVVAGTADGVECRMWIGPPHMERLERRRRRLAGVTGCGMCGLESLDEALRQPPSVPEGATVAATDVARAVASLRPAQLLNGRTRAVHAAGFWTERDGLFAMREDVGRHNALDKLRGALALASVDPASGILLLTSRLSVELVQKAAGMGATVVAAVSAPTGLALDMAECAGLTMIGIARDDGFEVFTRPDRIR